MDFNNEFEEQISKEVQEILLDESDNHRNPDIAVENENYKNDLNQNANQQYEFENQDRLENSDVQLKDEFKHETSKETFGNIDDEEDFHANLDEQSEVYNDINIESDEKVFKENDNSDGINVLIEKMDGMKKTINELSDLVIKLSRNAELTAKQLNQVNDNLHKENQKLKEGLYESLTKPILKDIIELSSNTIMDIERYRKNGKDDVADAIQNVLDDVHVVLERYDVEVYQPQPGDIYEPIVQKVVKTIATEDEQMEKHIAELRGFGYRYLKNDDERIIIVKAGNENNVLTPCKVYVYKFEK